MYIYAITVLLFLISNLTHLLVVLQILPTCANSCYHQQLWFIKRAFLEKKQLFKYGLRGHRPRMKPTSLVQGADKNTTVTPLVVSKHNIGLL